MKGAVATSRESESTYQTLVDEIFSKINKEYRQYKLHQRLLKNRSKETKLIYNHPVPVNFLMKSSHYIPSPFYAFITWERAEKQGLRWKKKKRERPRRGRIRLPRPNLEVNSHYRCGEKPASWLRAGE